MKRLSERLDEANQKFAEVKTHFGANHPEYRRAAEQVNEVQRQIDSAWQNIAHRVEIEYRQALDRERMLERDGSRPEGRVRPRQRAFVRIPVAEARSRSRQEAVRGTGAQDQGSRASTRASRTAPSASPIAARAPAKPVTPNIKLNAFLALLFSSVLALSAAIVSDLVDDTIRDPEQAQRSLNTPGDCDTALRQDLAGSPAGDRIEPRGLPGPGGRQRKRRGHVLSSYAEAIRTLRNSLLLSDFDRRMRSILVTSASTGEGKSTAAAHLAVAHAHQGQKTLLIDGDLRRPSIAKRFDLSPAAGLSNVLGSESEWRDALVKFDGAPHLDILAAGPPSRRAADLIGRGMFELIEEAVREYDLVILDGPPLPGFAEPLQMASSVDGVIVVTRAGQTSRKAVGSVISTLRRLRVNVVGLVLNQVKNDMSQSYYYYRSYHKYYQADHRGLKQCSGICLDPAEFSSPAASCPC